MQNADYRFCAQIRSHFLLHQAVSSHRYSEEQPYFRPPHNWHTSSDITWDIPTFCCPSICQSLGTLLGTSLLFCCCSIGTQIVTLLGISQYFRFLHFQPNRDTFRYTQFVLTVFARRKEGHLLWHPMSLQ